MDVKVKHFYLKTKRIILFFLFRNVYIFVFMEAKLKMRHDLAKAKLKSVAMPKIEKHTLKEVINPVAKNLNVAPQTVVNYIYGRAKDGFLTEAIMEEVKSLKL